MALKKLLDTPYDIDVTIYTQQVDSFAFNIEDSLIFIGYSVSEQDGTIFQSDIPVNLQGQDFTDFVTRMNELEDGGMTCQDAQMQTALEYCPGIGTITGLEKELTTPYVISGTVIGQDVDSFAYNAVDKIVFIGYSNMESLAFDLQENVTHALTGQEFVNFNERFNELGATMSASQAEIQTCLEFLPLDGTIQDV